LKTFLESAACENVDVNLSRSAEAKEDAFGAFQLWSHSRLHNSASGRETVVAQLPSGANHWTRDVVFSPDGMRMFVSVGSASDIAEGIGKRNDAELAKWNAEHPLGAAWGAGRVQVLRASENGEPRKEVFAVAQAVTLVGGAPEIAVGSDGETDAIADSRREDTAALALRREFQHISAIGLVDIGANEDPRHRGARLDLKDKITVPDVLLQAHSASLGITFYTGQQFPPERPRPPPFSSMNSTRVGSAVSAFSLDGFELKHSSNWALRLVRRGQRPREQGELLVVRHW
jgi:hypothetical protein